MPEPRCHLSLDCELGPHAPDAHPCGQRKEEPGTPCRYCGDPTPLDGSDCPKCWQPMTIPMFKAWAASHGWDTEIRHDG